MLIGLSIFFKSILGVANRYLAALTERIGISIELYMVFAN